MSVGWAGLFQGRVAVIGYLSKGGGGFLIDHPVDPENKLLNHSFVESPDMKNIYDGVVVADSRGEAWVEMPSYFNALNQEFRYQLTTIGRPAQVYIAEEISANRFKIAGAAPGMKVSWQVTGVRQDRWAQTYYPGVEIQKAERGQYLHPELYGQKEDRRIEPSKLLPPKTK